MNISTKCSECHGRGRVIKRYSHDDWAPDYCSCPLGQKMERTAIEDAEDSVELAICEAKCDFRMNTFHSVGCLYRTEKDENAELMQELRVDDYVKSTIY